MTSTVDQPSCASAIGKAILATAALMVVHELVGRRLTNVNAGNAPQMLSW